MRTLTPPHTHIMPRRQGGLSLVEMMISLTIGMLLLMGITTLIVRQSSSRDELEKSSRQIENGRYATQVLRNDIQHAGFYGVYSPAPNYTYTTPDPCASWSGGWSIANLQVASPIFGYSNATAAPSCVTNRLPGTAILVVHRTDTSPVTTAIAATNPNTIYLQTTKCQNETITPFLLGAISAGAVFNLHQKDCTSFEDVNKYYTRIYYISSCNTVDASNNCTDTTPTLKMVENNGPAIPLVEGIENMQFDYGLDSNNDGYPDGNYTATPAATDWPNVMAVRINVLARNIECSTGYTDTKQYNLGVAGTATGYSTDGQSPPHISYNLGLTGAPTTAAVSPCTNGDYKHHAFSELIRVVNPSARRAQE